MTAKKGSLLERGVLRQDHTDTRTLLSPENINRVQLLTYARDAAKWTTGLEQEFALNHYGEPDVAMFDFTSMYAAENACRAKKIVPFCCIAHNGKSDSGNLSGCCDCHGGAFHQNNKKMRKEDDISKKYHPLAPVSEDSDRTRFSSQLCGMEWKESLMRLSTTTASSLGTENGSFILLGLVGDSLLEPFWPTGSGCARGFLSAMDSAWMVRQWVMKGCPWNEEEALQVLREREQIYRLLGQTKSENLSQNYISYTLNPLTRYPNLNSSTAASTAMTGFNECRHLLYDDVHPPMPGSHMSNEIKKQSLAAKRARRATIASILPFEQGRKSESPESLKETSEERDPSPISLSKSRTSPIGDLSSSMSSSRLRRSKTVKVEPLKAVSVEYSNGGNKRRKEEKSLLHQVLTSSLSSSMSSSTHESSPVRQQREDPSRVDQSFEDSLADFESNYQGLLSSPTPSSLSHSSSATVVNSSRSSDRTGDKCRSSAFNDLMLSPSASNLATIGRTRAKDIESALRHRRAQQSIYERPSSLSISESSHGYQKSSTISNMPSMTSMREKVSSLIESGNTANNDRGFENQLSQSSGKDDWAGGPSFHNKIKTLEQKLAAASGIPLDRFGQVTRPELIDEEEQRRAIKSGGSHVLEAASTLEQLLDPCHQEEKLKEKAKDYHKKTSDIKVVMKMTRDTDWNKKCWEEREKKAQEAKNPPPKVSPIPRPRKLLDVFQDKKEEITSKLRDSPSRVEGDKLDIRTLSSTKKPRSRKGAGGDETDWISLLKGELSERSTNHVIAKTAIVKAPLKSPFGDTAEEKSRGAKFDFVPSRRNSKGDVKDSDNGRSIQMDYEKPLFTGTTTGSSTGMSSRCARCAEKIALVDRVVMSGVVIHRSCLTCSRCGVSLRLSEVRNGWLTNGQWGYKPTINSSHFICSLCQKNSSTVLTSVTSSDVVSSRPPRSPNSPRRGNLTTSSSGHMVSGSNSSNSSSHPTDEYELKIKERMKWKEQFLSDNNGLDFTLLVKRDLENSNSGLLRTSSTSSISQTITSSEGTLNGQSTKLSSNLSPLKEELPSPGSNPPVLERIEYENTSKSRELFDDDELSRMLNLSTNFEGEDDDQEDEEDTSNSTEETSGSTSTSWKKSQDSTDADFDSDEAFDANSHRSPKISNKSTPLEEKSIPDIIVETSEEVHLIDDHENNLREVATTDEISTHVLDGSTVATPTLSFSQSVTLASEEEDDDSLTLHEDNMVVRRKSSKKNSNQRKPTLDSVSRQDIQEGDRTSLSSLSYDTTFDDVNLVSLITDEETKNGQQVVSGKIGQSTSKDNHVSSMSISTTATKSSTNPPLLASNNYSSNSHIGSNNSNFSIYSPLLTSSLLTSLSNSRNSNPSSMSTNSSEKTLVASSSSTTISNSTNSMIRHSTPLKFKVAQPKFTVFNFDQPAVTPSHNGQQQQHSQIPWHVSSRVNNLPTILTKTSPSTSLLLNDINRRSSTGSSAFLLNRNHLPTDHPITPPATGKEGIADGEGKPVVITPSSDVETYSKIPILLSARVSDVQPAMLSTISTSLTQGQPQPKPLTTLKAVPSYSGSFTEKLLQRCRSTPSVPGEAAVGTALGKENKPDSPQAILAKWACSNLIVQPPRNVRTPASTTLLLSRGTTNGSGGAGIPAPAKTSTTPVTTIRSSLVKPTIGSSYCSSLNSTNLTKTTSRRNQSPLATATPISTRR